MYHQEATFPSTCQFIYCADDGRHELFQAYIQEDSKVMLTKLCGYARALTVRIRLHPYTDPLSEGTSPISSNKEPKQINNRCKCVYCLSEVKLTFHWGYLFRRLLRHPKEFLLHNTCFLFIPYVTYERVSYIYLN